MDLYVPGSVGHVAAAADAAVVAADDPGRVPASSFGSEIEWVEVEVSFLCLQCY